MILRTKEHKEYRNTLAKKFRLLRWQWDKWRDLAQTLYQTLKTNEQYTKAQNGCKIKIEKWEDRLKYWDATIIYTKPKQKFILAIDTKNNILKFLSEDLELHRDIYHKYIEEWICLWWGALEINDKKSTITVSWESIDYWSLPEKYEEYVKYLLTQKYQGYKISMPDQEMRDYFNKINNDSSSFLEL